MVRRIIDFQTAQQATARQVTVLAPANQETHITVKLGDILPALTDALLSYRAWVQDFEEDRIEVSKDLFEVIKAYERMRNAA